MIELIKLILAAVAKFFGWQDDTRMLNAGNAEQKAADAEETVNEIVKAQTARDDARKSTGTAASTDELPDDGFRRD